MMRENNSKKEKVLKIIIVILTILLVACISYITYDYVMVDTLPMRKTPRKIKEVSDITVTKDDEDLMLKIARAMYNDKNITKFNDLDDQTKLNIAITLSGESIEKVTGDKLISTIKKYYGEDAKLNLVDYKCTAHYDINGSDILYKYNSKTDKYIYNEEHYGHGGSTDPSEPVHYLGEDSYSVKGNTIYFKAGVFYMENYCYSDICYPATNMKIYKTYNAAKNKLNPIIDAVNNDGYCTKNNDFSDQVTKAYDCDNDKIFLGLKNDLNTYTFEFTKYGDNLIFNMYK